MQPKDLKMFAKEVAKKLKTEQDLSNFEPVNNFVYL